MEVSGKRLDPSTLTSPDQSPCNYCHPCQSDGKRLPVEGYCETCREYLCKDCFNIHTKPSPLRHHVLLDKSSMPKQSHTGGASPTKSRLVTVRCPDHTDKLVEFFCPSHDSVVCAKCAVQNHKICAVKYIPDLKFAENYKDNEEYYGITDSLDKLESDFSICINDVSENEKSVEEKTTKAVTDIQSFRKEINTYLDQQEQQLLNVVSATRTEDEKKMQDIKTQFALLKRKVQDSKNKLRFLENNSCDLFVVRKQVTKQMTELKKSLKEGIEKNQSPVYKFKLNESVKNILSSKEILGCIERSYEPRPFKLNLKSVQIKQLPGLSVKTSDDKHSVLITGMALILPDTLLVVDWNNSALKAVDKCTRTVKARLSLTGSPFDLTVLPGQAAVTVPLSKQIKVISVTANKLSALGFIAVSGECQGICSTEDIFVVTYRNPEKVEVMDHTGTVLHIITDESLFANPCYVSFSRENSEDMICVSDCNTNTITKLTVGGEIRSMHRQDHWRSIMGLTCMGDGHILLCNRERNTVELMNQDGSVVIPYIQKSHGLEKPRAICYSEADGVLFISSFIPGRHIHAYALQ